MRPSFVRLLGLFSMTLLLLAAGVATAQNGTCTELASNALAVATEKCTGLDRGVACFGNPGITAAFNDPALSADTFSKPGDTIEVSQLTSIRADWANLTDKSLGVTLMNIDASLPKSIQGKGVVIIAGGGIEIENQVTPETAFQVPEEALTGVTVSATDLRTAALSSSLVLRSVPASASVSIDAISPDSQWVRAVYQKTPGWLARSALNASFDPSSLAVVGPDTFTPMQSFNIRVPDSAGNATSASNPCAEEPPYVIVQGPTDTTVDVQVNGVPLRISSTAIFRIVGDQLTILTLYGVVTLYPDTPYTVYIPPGYTVDATLLAMDTTAETTPSPEDELTLKPEDFSTLRMATLEEMDLLAALFSNLPRTVLNYPVVLPIVVVASGRTVTPLVVFPDPNAVSEARKLCTLNLIAQEICQSFSS